MKPLLLTLLLKLGACSRPTPAETGGVVKASVDVARLACVALLDPRVPRTPETQARCDALVQGCRK